MLLLFILFFLFHGSSLVGMETSSQGAEQSFYAQNHEIIKRAKKILYCSALWSTVWMVWGIKDIVYNQFEPDSYRHAWEKTGFGFASLFLHLIAIPLAQDIKRNHS